EAAAGGRLGPRGAVAERVRGELLTMLVVLGVGSRVRGEVVGQLCERAREGLDLLGLDTTARGGELGERRTQLGGECILPFVDVVHRGAKLVVGLDCGRRRGDPLVEPATELADRVVELVS